MLKNVPRLEMGVSWTEAWEWVKGLDWGSVVVGVVGSAAVGGAVWTWRKVAHRPKLGVEQSPPPFFQPCYATNAGVQVEGVEVQFTIRNDGRAVGRFDQPEAAQLRVNGLEVPATLARFFRLDPRGGSYEIQPEGAIRVVCLVLPRQPIEVRQQNVEVVVPLTRRTKPGGKQKLALTLIGTTKLKHPGDPDT